MKISLIYIAIIFTVFFSYTFGQDVITFDDQGWSNDQVLNTSLNVGDYTFSSSNNFYTNYGYDFNVNQNSLYYVYQTPSTDKITITTKNNELVKFISVGVYQVSESSTQNLIIEGWKGSSKLYTKSFSNLYAWQTLSINFADINKVIIKLASSSSTDLVDYNFDNFSFEVIPLPVELTSFKALSGENSINLSWRTATEINNFGFDVERKDGNTAWQKIGFLKGEGSTTISKYYGFSDKSVMNGTKYTYRLKQIDNNGDFKYSEEINVTADITPKNYGLDQNYPNPFNPTTIISWQSPESGRQAIKVYDILGNEVATLIDENKPAGSYKVEFNPGRLGLSSGVYIYKLISNDFVSTKKMIMLK